MRLKENTFIPRGPWLSAVEVGFGLQWEADFLKNRR